MQSRFTDRRLTQLYRPGEMVALPEIVSEAMGRLLPTWSGALGIVAVSGGADSVALLSALHTCQPPGGLLVAHLNHRLRGDESEADEQFARRLAEEWNLPCRVKGIDMAREATGENLEAVARATRYRWFAELALEMRAGWIATGHHADDQAETVLHRLIRGTGLQGLRGIAPMRRDGPVPVIRPLLSVSRSELSAYLAERRIPHRTDSSNADLRFTRNRIRHELLPLLKSFNPEVVSALGRTAQQTEEFFLEQRAEGERLLASVELPSGQGPVVLDAIRLESTGEPSIRLVFRALWARERWPMMAMTFAHWERLAKIARGAPAADFPGGIHVRRIGASIQLQSASGTA